MELIEEISQKLRKLGWSEENDTLRDTLASIINSFEAELGDKEQWLKDHRLKMAERL